MPTLSVGLLTSGRHLFEPDSLSSWQKIRETSKFRRCYCHLEADDKGRLLTST
jgi:hypothetical protein